MITALAIAVVVTLTTVTAGRGVSALTPTPSTTPSTTPPTASVTSTVTPPGFTDAMAVRDELLAIAQQNLAEMARANFNGFFHAWGTPYPGIAGSGYAVLANPDRVSTWYTMLSSNRVLQNRVLS